MTKQPPKQRYLVLDIKPTRQAKVEDFLVFADALRKQGVDFRDDVSVEINEEGHLTFLVPVAPAPVPRQTAQQKAAAAQIAARQNAVKQGEPVPGHVPPAKPKRKMKIKKSTLRKVQK